jgi:hypothetical protein
VDVTLWYDFGAANVLTQPADFTDPAARACRVELVLETEMAEQKYTCLLPLGKPWSWNLISDGERIRQAPPSKLPPELIRLCKKR